MSQHQTVIVNNRGCGSGCGGLLAVLFVVGAIALAFESIAEHPAVAITAAVAAVLVAASYLAGRVRGDRQPRKVSARITCPACGEESVDTARCPRCGHRFF